MNKKRSATKDSYKRKVVKNMNKSKAKSSLKKTKQTKSSSSDSDRDPILLQFAEQDGESREIDCEYKALLEAENKVLRLSLIQPLLETVQDNSSQEMQGTKAQLQVQKGQSYCQPQVQNTLMQLHSQVSTNDSAFRIQEEVIEPLLGKADNSSLTGTQELSMRAQLQAFDSPQKSVIQSQLHIYENRLPSTQESFIQSSVSKTENESLRKLQKSILQTKSQNEDQDSERRIEESLMQPQISLQNVPPKKRLTTLLKTKEQRSLKIREILMPSKHHKEENKGKSSIVKDSLGLPRQNLKNYTPSMNYYSNIEVEKNTKNIDLRKMQNDIKIKLPELNYQSAENINSNITTAESLVQLQKCHESWSPGLNQLNLDSVVKKTKNQDLLKIQETGIQSKIEVENSQQRNFNELLLQQKQILDKRSKRIRKSNTHQGLQKTQTSVNKVSRIVSKIRKIQQKPILENKPITLAFPISQSNQNQGLQKSQTLMQPKPQQAENIHKESRIIGETLIQIEKLPENVSPKVPNSVIDTIIQRAQNLPDMQDILMQLNSQKKESSELNIVRESVDQPQRIPKRDWSKMWEKCTHQPLKRTEHQGVPSNRKLIAQSCEENEQNEENNSVPRLTGGSLILLQNISENYPLRIREPITQQTTKNQDVAEIQQTITPSKPHRIEENVNESRIIRELLIQPQKSAGNKHNVTEVKEAFKQSKHRTEVNSESRIIGEFLMQLQKSSGNEQIVTEIQSKHQIEVNNSESRVLNLKMQPQKSSSNEHIVLEIQSDNQIEVNNSEPRTLRELRVQPQQSPGNELTRKLAKTLLTTERAPSEMGEYFIEPFIETQSSSEKYPSTNLESIPNIPLQMHGNQSAMKTQEVITRANLPLPEYNSVQRIAVAPFTRLCHTLEEDFLSMLEANIYTRLKRIENKVIPNIEDILTNLIRQKEENYNEQRIVGESLVHPERFRESVIHPLLQTTEHHDLPHKQDISKPKMVEIESEQRIDRESVNEPHNLESNQVKMNNYFIHPPVQKTENESPSNIQTTEEREVRSDIQSLNQPHYTESNPRNMLDYFKHPPLEKTENQNRPKIKTAEKRISGESLIEPHYSESNPPNMFGYMEYAQTHPSLRKTENGYLQKISEEFIEPKIQTAENNSESSFINKSFNQQQPFSINNPPSVRESVIHQPTQKTESAYARLIGDLNMQFLLHNLQTRTLGLEDINPSMLLFISNSHHKKKQRTPKKTTKKTVNQKNVRLEDLDQFKKWLNQLESVTLFNTQRYISVLEKLDIWKHLMRVNEDVANKFKYKRYLYNLQEPNIKKDSKEVNETDNYLEIECFCRKTLHHLKIERTYFQTSVTLFSRYRMIYANQSKVLNSLSLEQELQRNAMTTLNTIDQLTYWFNELSVMLAEIEKSAEKRITMCLKEFKRLLDLCKLLLDF